MLIGRKIFSIKLLKTKIFVLSSLTLGLNDKTSFLWNASSSVILILALFVEREFPQIIVNEMCIRLIYIMLP